MQLLTGVQGRLTPIRALLALLGVTTALSVAAPRGHAQVPELPNFIVIVTDDERADTMRVLPATRTWFDFSGTRYPNAYATTPLCCPSRASIFTGRYAHNHGVQSNRGAGALDQETTIQYYLQNSGYMTGLFGKYLNEWKADPPHFDRWATVPSSRHYRNSNWNVNGSNTFVAEYSTLFLERKSLEFIDESEGLDQRPWLMFVAPQAPHAPFTSSFRYHSRNFPWHPDPSVNEADVSDKPRYVRKQRLADVGRARRMRTRQLRTLLSVDDLIDSLFNRLVTQDELDHTYVFFLSDNGFMWADHRMLSRGTLKNTPYNGSVRIPYLFFHPASPSETDERLVANIDVAPTIYDLADAKTRTGPPFDGRSLMDDSWDRQWLLLEWWEAVVDTGIPPWHGLRSATRSYVEYDLSNGSTMAEYYDLVNDPYELDNLLRDGDPTNDPNTTELHELLAGYSTCSGANCP